MPRQRPLIGPPRTLYRAFVFVFSVACYGAFLLVFLYLLAFLGNLQVTPLAEAVPAIRAWVPYSIDLGRDMGTLGAAMLINLGLIALFGVQHSVMARPGFKRAWTRIVPKEAERSTYVLIASAVLAFIRCRAGASADEPRVMRMPAVIPPPPGPP